VILYPEGYTHIFEDNCILVICHGCSRKHEDNLIKGQCHLFRNLEYLEWCCEKRLAL
jgi:hypothetical protein